MAKTTVSPRATKTPSRCTKAVTQVSAIPSRDEVSATLSVDGGNCLHAISTDAMEPTLTDGAAYQFEDNPQHDPKNGQIVAAWVVMAKGGTIQFKRSVVRRCSIDPQTRVITLTADKPGVLDIVGKERTQAGHKSGLEIVVFAHLISETPVANVTVRPSGAITSVNELSEQIPIELMGAGESFDSAKEMHLRTVATTAMEPTVKNLETYIFEELDAAPRDGEVVAARVNRGPMVLRRFSRDPVTGVITLTADNPAHPPIVGAASGHDVELVVFARLYSSAPASKEVAVSYLVDGEAPPVDAEPDDTEYAIPHELQYLFRPGGSYAHAWKCLPFCRLRADGEKPDFWAVPKLDHLNGYTDGCNIGELYGAAVRIYANRNDEGYKVLKDILLDMTEKGAPQTDVHRGVQVGFLYSIIKPMVLETEREILESAHRSIARNIGIEANYCH